MHYRNILLAFLFLGGSLIATGCHHQNNLEQPDHSPVDLAQKAATVAAVYNTAAASAEHLKELLQCQIDWDEEESPRAPEDLVVADASTSSPALAAFLRNIAALRPDAQEGPIEGVSEALASLESCFEEATAREAVRWLAKAYEERSPVALQEAYQAARDARAFRAVAEEEQNRLELLKTDMFEALQRDEQDKTATIAAVLRERGWLDEDTQGALAINFEISQLKELEGIALALEVAGRVGEDTHFEEALKMLHYIVARSAHDAAIGRAVEEYKVQREAAARVAGEAATVTCQAVAGVSGKTAEEKALAVAALFRAIAAADQGPFDLVIVYQATAAFSVACPSAAAKDKVITFQAACQKMEAYKAEIVVLEQEEQEYIEHYIEYYTVLARYQRALATVFEIAGTMAALAAS